METKNANDRGTVRTMPDPSTLTTQQLWREVESLKEILSSRIEAIEKAIEVAHDDLVRVPTEVQKQVGALRELHDQKFKQATALRNEKFDGIQRQLSDIAALRNEKFAGVQKQIDILAKQIEQSSEDNRVALQAALQAAKELGAQAQENIKQASEKQDASFSKQIDVQGALIHAMEKAFDSKITEIKDRLSRDTGRGEGQKEIVSTRQVSSSYNVALIGLIVAILVGASMIIFAILNR